MFQVGDRVRKRHFTGESNRSISKTGRVISVIGKWITVKHDKLPSNRQRGLQVETPRYDYQEYELEHVNPILRVAAAL